MKKMSDIAYDFYCCGGAKDPKHPMHDPGVHACMYDGNFFGAYNCMMMIGKRTAKNNQRPNDLETAAIA